MRSPLLFSLTAILFLFPLLSPGQDEEVDPRLTAILKEIQAAEDNAGAGEQARTEKYIEDLKALEKKVAGTGDLDKVLQVTGERKAWEAGKPTPMIDPQDNSVILDLRKLRYYFVQDLEKVKAIEKVKRINLNKQFADKLDDLVKTLTTEGKAHQALEVRKIYQDLLAATSATEKGNNQTKPDAPVEVAQRTEPTPSTEPPSPPVPPITSRKEGTTVLMKWIARGQAYAVVNDGGRDRKIVGSSELPGGKFELKEVHGLEGCAEDFPWHCLPAITELRNLRLHSQASITADDLRHLAKSKKLSHLSLMKSQFSRNAIEGLPELPSLERLALAYSKGNHPDWISKVHSTNPRLQHFWFGSPQPIAFTGNDLKACADFKDLKSLTIDFPVEFDVESVTALAKSRNLSSLGLYRNTTFAPGSIKGMEDWPKFQTLRLKEARESLFDSIPQFLELKNLENLGIHYSGLTDAHLGIIAETAGRSLEHLRLGNLPKITDAGITKLGTMKYLKTLEISKCNQVSTAGVDALKKLLRRCEITYRK